MKIKGVATIAALGLSLNLAFSSDSMAGLMLTLDDGINPVVSVLDGGVGDLASNSGQIAYFGSLGVWDFTLAGGISNSPSGSLHLSSVNNSTEGGTLTITLLDDTFISPTGTMARSGIGGVTDGTVEFSSYVDGNEVAHFGPMGGLSFSAETSTMVATGSPYTIMATATIVHGPKGGTTSFDSSVTVPEPGTLALLGLGLLGIGVTSRKKSHS